MEEGNKEQEQRRKECLRKSGVLLSSRDYTCSRLREKLPAVMLLKVRLPAVKRKASLRRPMVRFRKLKRLKARLLKGFDLEALGVNSPPCLL